MIFAEGLEAVYARHARLARATRAAGEALGLKQLAENPVNGVTALYGPDGMDTEKIVDLMLNKYGVAIAEGQGKLKGKIFRIGHMGYVSEEDLLVAISTLEMTLKDLGYEFELGSGVRAAQEALT